MNLKKITFALIIPFTLLSLFSSCGEDRYPEYLEKIELDSWVDSLMREDYIWYKEMPNKEKLNFFLPPADFIKSICSSKDRDFSFVDSLREVPEKSFGFDYQMITNPKDSKMYALINYIVPNSPAAKANLKRGDWLMALNKAPIKSSFSKLLEVALRNNQAITVDVGRYEKDPLNPSSENEDEEDKESYSIVLSQEGVEIGQPLSIVESPIHSSKLISLRDGTKTAYLMYNSFTSGTPKDEEKYNNELRQLTTQYKSEEINRLILDLRLNRGGAIYPAQLLTTLLAPQEFLGEKMGALVYNDKKSNKNRELYFDRTFIKTGENLNLTTLVLLTSRHTAGAAEALINNLRGKLDLVIIGSTTKGQFVATEPFVNEKHRWIINPAVCVVCNSEMETFDRGFQPTFPFDENSDFSQYLPFGDEQELLLSKAIDYLNGDLVIEEPTADEASQQESGNTNNFNYSLFNHFSRGLQLK